MQTYLVIFNNKNDQNTFKANTRSEAIKAARAWSRKHLNHGFRNIISVRIKK